PTTDETYAPNLQAALYAAIAAHPERTWNLLRAATIIAKGGVSPATPHGWWVSSQYDPAARYWVYRFPTSPAPICECPDYQHRGGPCKHGCAVELALAVQRAEIQADEQAEAAGLVRFPQRGYTDADRFILTPKGYAALGLTPPDEDPELPP